MNSAGRAGPVRERVRGKRRWRRHGTAGRASAAARRALLRKHAHLHECLLDHLGCSLSHSKTGARPPVVGDSGMVARGRAKLKAAISDAR